MSLDTGVIYKGYQSDAARTHGVGESTEDARLLIERTRPVSYTHLDVYKRQGHGKDEKKSGVR